MKTLLIKSNMGNENSRLQRMRKIFIKSSMGNLKSTVNANKIN